MNMNRCLGWTLLVTTLWCHTARAQEAAPTAEHATYDLRADADRDLVDEGSGSESPSLLTDRERLRVRRALNLELAGWLIAVISVPGFAVVPGTCYRARISYRATAATVGFGISTGMVGTILRARRMRGHERLGFRARQGLFRSPVGRAFGMVGLMLGAAMVGVAIPAMEIPLRCTD